MFGDAKRQAGAAAFLRHHSMTPVPELSRAFGGGFVATAIEGFFMAEKPFV
jgi:hypothetical protein